jgi:hypothetical protein
VLILIASRAIAARTFATSGFTPVVNRADLQVVQPR